jgi:hypothetical protein
MKSALVKKGVHVSGEVVLNKSDILGKEKINDLFLVIRQAAAGV